MSLRPLFHALLSAVVPGTGQIAAGARRRGYIMLAVVGLLLIVGVAIAFQGSDEVLSWAVRPQVLLALLGINVVLLAFRLFAVIDAYRTTGGRPGRADRSSRPAAVAGGVLLALVVLLTVAPHGAAGYYTYLSHDLLTSVFSSEDVTSSTVASPTTATSSTSTSGTTPASTSVNAGSATSTTATTELSPETTAELNWGEDQRLTILLIGTDAGYGRRGARADSVMVATFDLENGYVALFGIPRNAGSLPLGERTAEALGRRIYPDMLSNLYESAWNHPEIAPEGGDPGAVAVRDTASKLLGLPIQYYAVVDMAGLVDVIDAFGGITLNLKERFTVRLSPPSADDEWRVYDILPGRQELDGHEALAFARSRTGTSDYDRMRRQRCVLKALLYQNGVAELALKFPVVVKAIRDNLSTDIPIERLPDLIKVRAKLKTDEMLTVGFTPPNYISGRNELGYNILDQELVQAAVRRWIEDPQTVLGSRNLDIDMDTTDCWKVD